MASPTARHTLLVTAIARSKSDLSEPISKVVETPGYRAQLRRQFDNWTRLGFGLGDARGPHLDDPNDPSRVDRWRIYRAYRALLDQNRLEDDVGLVVWAVSRLADPSSRSRLERFRLDRLVLLDLDRVSDLRNPVLDALFEAFADLVADGVMVSLEFADDSARTGLSDPTRNLKDWLVDEAGFDEVPLDEDPRRPQGLVRLSGHLFGSPIDPVSSSDPESARRGVQFIEQARGERQGLAVAHQVLGLLRRGVAPNRIAVLFRNWDEQATLTVTLLNQVGIATDDGQPVPAARAASVSALRLAMALPIEGWPVERLASLLRHGLVHARWVVDGPEPDRDRLARAANAVLASGAFRDSQAILTSLRRRITKAKQVEAREQEEANKVADRRDRVPRPPGSRLLRRAAMAQDALDVVEPLVECLETWAVQRSWETLVGHTERLADALGLSIDDDPDLTHLFDLLADQAEILQALGQADHPWNWFAFVAEVTRLAEELPKDPAPPEPGAIRIGTCQQARGLRVDHLILGDMIEGLFPHRHKVLEALQDPERATDRLNDEKALFLELVGMAAKSLVFVVPVADESGERLLPSGFLHDVQECLDSREKSDRELFDSQSHSHLDPIDLGPLTLRPVDVRVRAVHRALSTGRRGDLGRLARSPEHREVLRAAVDALNVAHARSRDEPFGLHEGQIIDPLVASRLARTLGHGPQAFSPSQLETYIDCPFKFFLNYVLRLEPDDRTSELETDPAAWGSLVHKILEKLDDAHLGLTELDARSEDPAALRSRIAEAIASVLDSRKETEPAGAIARSLKQIERLMLNRTFEHYLRQFLDYRASDGRDAVCTHRELAFGPEHAKSRVVLGADTQRYDLQGKIDRIDQIGLDAPTPERVVGDADTELEEGSVRFRVIDYKSGRSPTGKDVLGGSKLQLPLYALAFERIAGPNGFGPVALLDMGYWELREHGFRKFDSSDWSEFRDRLLRYVDAVVSSMRAGAFAVAPRSEDCTATCDFRRVCRIGQVRLAKKSWDERPTLEAVTEEGLAR